MKMILMPIERARNQTPPDVELKLLQQERARKQHTPSNRISQTISLDDAVRSATSKVQKARTKEVVKHLKENKDRIAYDSHTGELEFSGLKAGNSDVRELVDSLTTTRKQTSTPKGWDLFLQALEGTGAPDELYVKTKRKCAKKVTGKDWRNLRNQ